jgi:hypothetical protein
MTVTIEQVQAIHKEHQTRGLTPTECVQGTRTAVHALFQAESPLPCTSITPEMQAARDARSPMTADQKFAQEDHQRDQVTPEQIKSYREARSSGDRNAQNCRDAHHWVQMVHQTSLWQRTDALCAQAGVK